jgi:hypothetical protein
MSAIDMHDAGRTWKQIAEATGLTVPEAMQEVAKEKVKRRQALARTPENERARGLLDECRSGYIGFTCRHLRKEHRKDGSCMRCDESEDAYVSCDGFTTEPRLFQGRTLYGRYKNDVGSNLFLERAKKHGVEKARELYGNWWNGASPNRKKRQLARIRRKNK